LGTVLPAFLKKPSGPFPVFLWNNGAICLEKVVAAGRCFFPAERIPLNGNAYNLANGLFFKERSFGLREELGDGNKSTKHSSS
jgi:hypothetical protein